MADRDVKVVYRSREIDDGYRPRIPTALDPYDHPYDRQSARRARSVKDYDSTSTVNSISSSKTPRTARTVYDDERRSFTRDDDVDARSNRALSARRSFDRDRSRQGRQTMDLDQSDRARTSQDRLDNRYARANSRTRQYVIDEDANKNHRPLQRDGNSYVMDTRGEVEIIMPGRNRDRTYDAHGPVHIYNGRSSQDRRFDDATIRQGERLSGGTISVQREVTPPSRYDVDRSYRARGSNTQYMRREDDRDDDWRLIESMRDTHLTSGREADQRRSRTATQSSEDSYIMVSPSQDSGQTMRSAMRHTDYAPAELRRRRSRSISFRESETVSHDAGDLRHERPGAEANICGPYLRRKPESEVDSDLGSYDYRRSSGNPRRSRSSVGDGHLRNDEYREAYPPQMDYVPRRRDRSRDRAREYEDNVPRRRERSRHRARDDQDDAASYYSEHVDKRYLKETRYM